MKQKSSANDLLKQIQAKAKSPISTTLPTPAGMYQVWRAALPRYTEGISYVAPFTGAETGMVKTLLKHWGDEAPKVLLAVVKGWVSFTKYCEANHGAYKTPMMPTLPFLTKYAMAALNWNAVQLVATPPKKTIDKPLSTTYSPTASLKTPTKAMLPSAQTLPAPSPEDDTEAPMTLEDLLAYKPKSKPGQG